MKYYVIDDNLATVMSLVNIIRDRKLGTVVGYSTNPVAAKDEILEEKPNIVLVDLLMSEMDGIQLVKSIRALNENIGFVMVSKVTSKDIISKAYDAGVEFFINKPINIVEVEKVLENVAEKVKMKKIVSNIRNMFDVEEESQTLPPKQENADINLLFSALGMLGEKGAQDLREIYQYLCEHECTFDREVLEKVADSCGETRKNFEQRIRRAIKKGLSNAAHVGIEDFSHETFAVYANYVYDFKALKEEMSFLQGKSESGGRVSLSKFVEGMMLYAESLK